jgi:hypothetical protein
LIRTRWNIQVCTYAEEINKSNLSILIQNESQRANNLPEQTYWLGDKIDEFALKNKQISLQQIDVSLINDPDKNSIIKESHQTVKNAIAITCKTGETNEDIEADIDNETKSIPYLFPPNINPSPKPKAPNNDDIDIYRTPEHYDDNSLSQLKKKAPTVNSDINCFSSPEINKAASLLFNKLKRKNTTPSRNKISNNQPSKTIYSKSSMSHPLRAGRDKLTENRIIDKKALLVTYESSILKYHPGFSIKFVERYAIVTRTHFIYFSNMWEAQCYSRPMMSIPLSTIKSIEIIKSDYAPNNIYEFDIILKQNMDPTSLEIKSASPVCIRGNTTPSNKYNKQRSPIYYKDANPRSTYLQSPSNQKLYNKQNVIKGHLMLSPEKQLLISNVESPKKSHTELNTEIIYDKIKFKTEQEVSNFKQYIGEHKATLLKRNRGIERIFSKSPKSWMLNFKGSCCK